MVCSININLRTFRFDNVKIQFFEISDLPFSLDTSFRVGYPTNPLGKEGNWFSVRLAAQQHYIVLCSSSKFTQFYPDFVPKMIHLSLNNYLIKTVLSIFVGN